MVDYVAIGTVNPPRERSNMLVLTVLVLLLITFVAATTIVLFIVMNLQYYEMFRGVLKVLSKNLATKETLNNQQPFRLVCYYSYATDNQKLDHLHLRHINDSLCTHVNIGMVDIVNSTINIGEKLQNILKEEVPILRRKNPTLKLLLWVGGGDSEESRSFKEMTRNHENRKRFIKSLKEALKTYNLDGVDLDWEFPSAYDKDRQHLSQLLYEIKAEYKRERKNYMLTVAVVAIEGIAVFAYDIRELNLYADYVNLMTYDFHFYSKSTPFTGLNAPLFGKSYEKDVLKMLNINYSIHWWLDAGIERNKLVVGLPTYGHSFKLVNPLNTKIEAPAEDFGSVGEFGFASYSDICYFNNSNLIKTIKFDYETCSPYMFSAVEWISFENEESISCKTEFIKSLNLGGIMVFSLNSDDTKGFCNLSKQNDTIQDDGPHFPLTNTIKKIMFS